MRTNRTNGILFAGLIAVGSLFAIAEAFPSAAAELELLPPPNMNPAEMPAGVYILDKRHAHITGTSRRQGISDFAFRFNTFDASFTYDPQNPEASKVEVTLDPASFDSGFEPIDNQLLRNFFEVMKFPEIKFVSTSITRGADNRGTMTGEVSMMGVTRPLTLDVTFYGFNSARRFTPGFGATATVNISDFGPVGVFFRDDHNLADEIKLTIDAIFDRM